MRHRPVSASRSSWLTFGYTLIALTGGYCLAATPPVADLLLLNGHILTMDPRDSVVEAVAVRGGRIVALGSSTEMRLYAGKTTEIIDLRGRSATPGLIDSHAHIADAGLDEVFSLKLGDARTVAELTKRVAAGIAKLKPGEWLRGNGWDEGKLAERRQLTARDLDAVSRENPVWLEHTTGHYGVANSLAMRLAGITSATKNPPAGTIDRDSEGRPSGVLKESAQDLVTGKLPPWTRQQRRAGITASLDLMHREGMTAVKDPAIGPEDWEAYRSLDHEGRLAAHVCVLWRVAPTIAAAEALAKQLGELPRPPRTFEDGNLMSCGVKIFMDGSGGAPTAWVYDEWHRHSTEVDVGNRGYPAIDPEIYRRQVRLFTDAAIHIGTHAIGDRAIDWVVDSYAAALAGKPTRGLRHGIIHANIPTGHAIETMARLQRDFDAGYPEAQPPFLWWIGDLYAGTFGPDRAPRLNPFQTYLQHDIRWAAGSDYPVTPLPARYGLWAAVVRETLLGTYGPQPFGTKEAIDIHTAMRSYTIWAARQLFIEGEAGSLEPGKSADIAVWDRDPYQVPAADLKGMRCEMTLFRGKVVFRAERGGGA